MIRIPITRMITQNTIKSTSILACKSCFSLTNIDYDDKNLLFVYKYLFFNLRSCIWNYNVASRIAIQLGELRRCIYASLANNIFTFIDLHIENTLKMCYNINIPFDEVRSHAC